MFGRDGVQHDQEDIGGARRRQRPRALAPLPDPISAPGRRRQDQHETGDDGKAEPQQPTEAGGMPLQGRDQPRRDPERHDEPGQSVDPRQANQEGRQQCQ